MKKVVVLLALLLITLSVLGISLPKEHVAYDPYGNRIYQVDTGEIKTGFTIIGEGEPLLLLMGLGGTIMDWPKTIIDMLSYEYQLILMDNRGMGYSTDTDKPFTYEMLSEDVVAFMDAIELKKAHMLGYSMGTIFIQYLFMHYPERVDRAILNATAINTSMTLENLNSHANAELPKEGPVKKQLDIVVDWEVNPELFKVIKNEVLLIHGRADNILDPNNSLILASAFENCWLVFFRGNTHYLIFENPVDFAYVCLDFLKHRR